MILAATLTAGAAEWSFESPELEALDGIARRSLTAMTGVAIDESVARTGRRSLRVDASSRRGGFSGSVAAETLHGERVRIDAYVRRAGPEAEPGLWIRIAGRRGFIYVDRVFAGRSASADRTGEGWQRVTIEAPLSRLARDVTFGLTVGGSGWAWFDDLSIDVTSLDDRPPASPVAAAYVDRALAIMERHSLRRSEVDWRGLRRAAHRQARGAVRAGDAHLAVQFALGEIDDGHSYFMSPRQMSRLEDEAPVSNARTGRAVIDPSGELLASGAGYIQVPGFAGGSHRAQSSFATALHEIIADLEGGGACGWIVDLRDNRGGNLWPMLAGLGPLLREGAAGAAVYPDATRETIWYRDGKVGLGEYVRLRVHAPYSLEAPASAVAVITNGTTASAAEIVAAAFAGEEGTRSFGAPTRGTHTGTRVFPLSDGSALILAVAATRDRRGELLDGPIVPDEPIASSRTDAMQGTSTPAVEAAERWIASTPQCLGAISP